MLFPIEVGLPDRDINKIIKLYKRAYKKIVLEISTATDFGIYNRRSILSQIEIILTKLGADVQDFLEKEIPNNYKIGFNQADRQLKSFGVELIGDMQFNLLHQEAIINLIDDTSKAFAGGITGVKRNAEMLLNKAVKEEIKMRMAEGAISGEATKAIRAYINGYLKDQGLASLIDKGGRKWTLDRYTDMLIRTKTAEARNRGLINRVVENKYDLVQVSSHPSSCPLCAPWQSKILSLTGNTKGYPTLTEAEESGLFHPNCRHAINVYDPEISKQTRSFNPKTGKYELAE
ncbi:phage minor capsid protein [Patescibacteria group bacterium]|nr:phage minor capsid protein [Patescibacteria group bacterium]